MLNARLRDRQKKTKGRTALWARYAIDGAAVGLDYAAA